MKEVSKKEFWQGIFDQKLDVHPRQEGQWPYTAIFEYRNSRKEYGRIVQKGDEKTYFISEEILLKEEEEFYLRFKPEIPEKF